MAFPLTGSTWREGLGKAGLPNQSGSTRRIASDVSAIVAGMPWSPRNDSTGLEFLG